MILRPCFRCPHRDTCDIEATMRAKLKGSGVTSAKFTCAIYKTLYKRGDVVEITVLVEAGDHLEESTCKGIVVRFPSTDCRITILIPRGWELDDETVWWKNPDAKEARMLRYYPETERFYLATGMKAGNKVVNTGETVRVEDYLCGICGKPPATEGRVDDLGTCGREQCRDDMRLFEIEKPDEKPEGV